jgi:hypothetical protein
MKTLVLKANLLIIVLVIGLSTLAQNTNDDNNARSNRKLRKDQKKEQKLIAQNAKFEEILQAISDSAFVFEARIVQSSQGQTNRLDATSSFFAVNGNQATIRVVADASRGLFGQSSAGYLIKYSINKKRSKKPVIVNGRIEPFNHVGKVMFTLSVFRDGNAILEIIPVNGSAYSMEGEIVLPQNSITYKGIPVIRERKLPEK